MSEKPNDNKIFHDQSMLLNLIDKEIAYISEKQKTILAGAMVDQKYRFSTVSMAWLLHREKTVRPGTMEKYRSSVNTYLLPNYSEQDIRDIDVQAYDRFIISIAELSKSASANAHRAMRAIYSFCVENQTIPSNPLFGRKSLNKKIRLPPRERYLSSPEINQFLNEITQQSITRDAQLALILELNIGLRIGEILNIKWPDIDFRAKIIKHPAHIMKNGESAETVMSDPVRRLLLEWKREKMNYVDNRVFSGNIDTSKLVDEVKKLKGWLNFSSHDLRRTVRTHLQELGCPEEIRRAITNHSESSGVSQHYDKAKMKKQQLHWLSLWSEKLSEVKEDPFCLNVGIESDQDDPLLQEFQDMI